MIINIKMIFIVKNNELLNSDEINKIIIKRKCKFINVIYCIKENIYWHYFDDEDISSLLETSQYLIKKQYEINLPELNIPYDEKVKSYYSMYSNVSLEQEEWRNIKGYEGLYQVSNMGRVKSIGHGEKFIKPGRSGEYWKFNLCRNGTIRSIKVHRAVAEAFIDDIPNSFQVDHINTNPNDNRACNLRIVSVKENMNNINTIKKRNETWKTKLK